MPCSCSAGGQKVQSRVKVRIEIEDTLDGLPRVKEIYATKCNALFEHVYESYYGEGGSVFEEAA
jgi:type I restriction enzyme, R subunit